AAGGDGVGRPAGGGRVDGGVRGVRLRQVVGAAGGRVSGRHGAGVSPASSAQRVAGASGRAGPDGARVLGLAGSGVDGAGLRGGGGGFAGGVFHAPRGRFFGEDADGGGGRVQSAQAGVDAAAASGKPRAEVSGAARAAVIGAGGRKAEGRNAEGRKAEVRRAEGRKIFLFLLYRSLSPIRPGEAERERERERGREKDGAGEQHGRRARGYMARTTSRFRVLRRRRWWPPR